MFTWKQTLMIAAIATVCGGTRIAAAQDAPAKTEPNYLCEAIMMRADAREVACQGRCQKLSDLPGDDGAPSPRAQCLGNCHDRCEETKTRRAALPPCTPEPPDPDRCAAKLLAALSQMKFCLSSCPSEPADRYAECSDRCNNNYGDSAQRIGSMDVCKDGGGPQCSYQ